MTTPSYPRIPMLPDRWSYEVANLLREPGGRERAIAMWIERFDDDRADVENGVDLIVEKCGDAVEVQQ